MNNLLTKLLNKRGMKREELSVDEKKDFERWETILDKGEVTVEKIQQFCEAQKQAIEAQWKDMGNSAEKNERLIIAHTIYTTIIGAISSPETERATLENYLNELINA